MELGTLPTLSEYWKMAKNKYFLRMNKYLEQFIWEDVKLYKMQKKL